MYAFRRSSSSPRRRRKRNNKSKSPEKRSRSRSRSHSRSSKIIISSKSVPSRKLYISKKNLKNIYNNKLTLYHEVCGFIEKGELNSLQVIQKENVSKSDRMSCQTRGLSQVIYHTHPNISKFYPSSEDILKIVKEKNKEIMCSIIFTKYGIWEIVRKNFVFYDLTDDKEDIEKTVKEILANIYNNNAKGRKLKDVDDIYTNINLIKEILSDYLIDIDIHFTLWTNSNYILYFQDFQ